MIVFRPKPIWIAVLLIVLAAALAAAGANTSQPSKTGRKAALFTLTGIDGKKYSLAVEIAGHPITVINFWATWCPPCRQEIPDYVAFYKKYKNRGVQVLAINMQESPGNVRAFAKKNGMTYPVLLDKGDVAEKYRIAYIPDTVIVDAHGIIREFIIGLVTGDTLSRKVAGLLPRRGE